MADDKKKLVPTIADLWDGYLKAVVPRNASENQIRGTQYAFYAGATVMYDLFTRMADLQDTHPEVVDDAAFHRLEDELRDFAKQVVLRTAGKTDGKSTLQ